MKNDENDYRLSFEFNKETSTLWQATPGFNSNFLTQTQIWANEKLMARGFLFLNEVLEMLGLPMVREGQTSGWVFGKWRTTVTFGIPMNKNCAAFFAGETIDTTLHFNCTEDILDLIWEKSEDR